jgi:protein O-GlcNAc transferase
MDPRAVHEQAVALHRAGRLAEAEPLYRRLVRADANNFPALHMLGFLKAQQQNFDEAARLLGRALTLRPGEPQALGHYASCLMMAGRFGEARAAYDQMLAANPQAIEALYNKGVILSELKRPAEALALFDRALALMPNAPNILYNRGVVLAALGRHGDALANYDRALQWQPDLTLALSNRALSVLNLCDWPRLEQIARETPVELVSPLVLLGYCGDKARQLACARAAIARRAPAPGPPLWRGERYNHDRIRLAYVSADFNEHAVGMQIAPLIAAHDRAKFEVIAISLGGEADAVMRPRLQAAFDQFHDCAAMPAPDIARLMHALEIDIAIDLMGHTEGARPEIFSWRPAPVHAAWLGYPGTTGADFIDYLIADAIVAPMEDQPFYSEKLMHLPDTYFPTDPECPIGEMPTRAQEGLPQTGFVFCAFNNGWKISAQMFDVWMRLLNAVPGSVLWLKQTGARKALERAAAARGIDPARLVFADSAPLARHLARHALADLCLDTLPYNGHATTVHALWGGVPVVTLKGEAFAGRVAASLLNAAGLPDLVTATQADYEALALRLAQQPGELSSLKQKLANNRSTAPLFDLDRFRRALEAAYLEMLSVR